MTVYVDDVRHKFGRMVMCHLWADTEAELDAFATRLNLSPQWKQKPPKASWVHYDVSLGKKAQALTLGAVLTDKYGPLEHCYRLENNAAGLEMITKLRERWKVNAEHQEELPLVTLEREKSGLAKPQ